MNERKVTFRDLTDTLNDLGDFIDSDKLTHAGVYLEKAKSELLRIKWQLMGIETRHQVTTADAMIKINSEVSDLINDEPDEIPF